MALNTQTSVALLPVSGNTDQIELVSGEAAIVADRQSMRPFAVLAGGGRATGQNAASMSDIPDQPGASVV